MECPHCKREVRAHANPWIVVVQQLVVLAVISFWFSWTVNTWDDEPYVLAAIFVTMLGLAFGKEKALGAFRKLMGDGNG